MYFSLCFFRQYINFIYNTKVSFTEVRGIFLSNQTSIHSINQMKKDVLWRCFSMILNVPNLNLDFTRLMSQFFYEDSSNQLASNLLSFYGQFVGDSFANYKRTRLYLLYCLLIRNLLVVLLIVLVTHIRTTNTIPY